MDENVGDIPELSLKKDDSFLALGILVGAIVLVLVIVIYLWSSKKLFNSKDERWKQASTFTPPEERGLYLAAKQKLDATKVTEVDDLKKLLMRRAIKTIPILLSLQNEGSSIERLYKRGMLTDDMHFKVKELKAFVDQEFQDIQFEADDLVEGWGQHVWPQAMQFHQMIQKQAEGKIEEQVQVEEEKKKSESQKRKEKERAKKALLKENAKADESSSLPMETDSEVLRAEEAERMAQQLLEEEEAERVKNGGKKSSKTPPSKKK